MIHVRPAGPDDADALARLRAASMIELGYLAPAERNAFVPDAARDFVRLFANGTLLARVLCDGDAIIGTAGAVLFERLPYPGGTLHAEVSGVYVEPAHRGTGHAGRLVADVLADLRRTGVRKIFLRPSPRSRGLYARLGFVEDTTGVMNLPLVMPSPR
ncbi:MAG: GNAT family N-acetyltransferase [Candidatus Eremiobacteraeota bacterium]|nr:GNAT family N-acetyltransferase [Candidatus Eremiobacteraeota bacterium]